MTGLIPLLKKEIIEQLRTYKLLIVAAIFLLFGITTPPLLKYLPQILELTGDSGIEINIPPPTAIQSLGEYTSTVGQIGVLLAVLIAMGSIANELRHGTAVITLSKPVSKAAFVNAKFIAMGVTFLESLATASLFCYVYTVWLIGTADLTAFIGQNLLLGLFLLFCLAVTMLLSSLFRSSLTAGGIALGLLIAQGVLSAIPRFGEAFPGKLLTWGNSLYIEGGQSYWLALGITITVITACLYVAQRILQKKDF